LDSRLAINYQHSMGTFLDLQSRVQTVMEAGRPMEDAEDFINDPSIDLSDDERAALWLWAWSLLPEHRQRYQALRYLELIESTDYH
jgi:hypothetical protein